MCPTPSPIVCQSRCVPVSGLRLGFRVRVTHGMMAGNARKMHAETEVDLLCLSFTVSKPSHKVGHNDIGTQWDWVTAGVGHARTWTHSDRRLSSTKGKVCRKSGYRFVQSCSENIALSRELVSLVVWTYLPEIEDDKFCRGVYGQKKN